MTPHDLGSPRAWLRLLPLLLILRAAAAPAGPCWIFRCADPAAARALLDSPATLLDALPAGARLEPALPGTAGAPGQLEAILRLSLPPGGDLLAARKELERLARPRWIEEPPLRSTDRVPDDPRYGEQWALPRIAAPAAWDAHTGQGEIVVAVVDTGCELSHPDLGAALWTNAVEAAGAPGVDDDGNGLVDDLHGGDLLDGDGDPSPGPGDLGHGTHTAGTAACATDNGEGVACPAWNARLLPVRAGHQSVISRGVEGIWYAAQAGARVISCSWGGDSFSAYENEVVQAVRALGVLVAASAGNNGGERPHYPGAYEGVLCVAASGPDDALLGSSQRGWWVDLCAPGLEILSTMIGGGYALRTGTSMATPAAASVCALAWSLHPEESGDQIRERVKAGCVNIDAANPGLQGKLGSGRLSALGAVAPAQAPRAVQLEGWQLSDGDGDGVPEPGEAIQLHLTLRALLGSFSSLAATCQLPEGGATIQDGQIAVGTLAQGQSASPADGLALTLDAGLEPGQELRVHLAFSAAGGFSQGADLLILVAPAYVDHDNGTLQLSVGGAGVQGYYDFAADQARGLGLRWPPGSPNHLYHGSLMLATDDGQVAHASSYLVGDPSEFQVWPGGEIRREQGEGELRSEAEFGAAPLPGLRVRQQALSRDWEHWLLLRFTLQNEGQAALAGLQPALWVDFDVGGSYNNDSGGWEEASGTGWMSQSGGPVLGLRLLGEAPVAYRLCRFGEWSGGAGLEDDELFAWLRGGFQQTSSNGPNDWQCLLGAAPQDLAPGARREAAFAVVAGSNVAELVQAGEEALLAWQELELADPPPRPARPGLGLELWPNPCNPEARFRVALAAGVLEWRVLDLAGRQVAAGSRAGLPAGPHEERLLLSGLPSGLYFLDVRQGGRSETARLLLLR